MCIRPHKPKKSLTEKKKLLVLRHRNDNLRAQLNLENLECNVCVFACVPVLVEVAQVEEDL